MASCDSDAPVVMPAAGACAAEGIHPGPAPARRLTSEQYNNTLRDLFDYEPFEPLFPATFISSGYRSYGTHNNVSAVGAHDIMKAAEQFAEVLAGEPDINFPCIHADPKGCARELTGRMGAQLFRRPLTSAELDAYDALFATAPDPEVGVRYIVEALLQSPQFLYLDLSPGEQVDGHSGVRKLEDHAIASRLSYLLWNTTPDGELMAAADAGKLGAVDEVEGQARRLLADARSANSVAAFHSDWLKLYRLGRVLKDDLKYPDFDLATFDSLRASYRLFFGYMLETNATLDELLTSREMFVDNHVGALVGVDGLQPGEYKRVSLSGDERAGVLTHPAFLTTHAHFSESSPVQRGVVILQQLLCTEMAPPDDVDTSPDEAELKAGETVRDKLASHREDAACASCHNRIDPLGLAFENFNPVGQWRDAYLNGEAVDATGTADTLGGVVNADGTTSEGSNVNFDGAIDLVGALASSQKVQDCYVRQVYRYALGRAENADDRCALESLQTKFRASGGDIVELLVALTRSDAFRYRPSTTTASEEE